MFVLCAQDNAPVGTAEGDPEVVHDVVQKENISFVSRKLNYAIPINSQSSYQLTYSDP